MRVFEAEKFNTSGLDRNGFRCNGHAQSKYRFGTIVDGVLRATLSCAKRKSLRDALKWGGFELNRQPRKFWTLSEIRIVSGKPLGTTRSPQFSRRHCLPKLRPEYLASLYFSLSPYHSFPLPLFCSPSPSIFFSFHFRLFYFSSFALRLFFTFSLHDVASSCHSIEIFKLETAIGFPDRSCL